jgi:DNA replication protein DnaC
MEHDAQLKIQLNRLKLSGILDTLDMRLLESQQNQLDYKSFLSLVLQDELEARQMRKVKRLLRHAHFGHEQTLESFDFSLAPALNATLIRELATCRFLERGEGVIFTGPPGTGKTHLAKALGHAACRHYSVLATTLYRFRIVDCGLRSFCLLNLR